LLIMPAMPLFALLPGQGFQGFDRFKQYQRNFLPVFRRGGFILRSRVDGDGRSTDLHHLRVPDLECPVVSYDN
jgi:hypothetical protein